MSATAYSHALIYRLVDGLGTDPRLRAAEPAARHHLLRRGCAGLGLSGHTGLREHEGKARRRIRTRRAVRRHSLPLGRAGGRGGLVVIRPRFQPPRLALGSFRGDDHVHRGRGSPRRRGRQEGQLRRPLIPLGQPDLVARRRREAAQIVCRSRFSLSLFRPGGFRAPQSP